jgi:hypothetical protein
MLAFQAVGLADCDAIFTACIGYSKLFSTGLFLVLAMTVVFGFGFGR